MPIPSIPEAADDPVLQALVLRVREAFETRTPLEIRGSGSKAFYGGPCQGEVLDLRPLAGVSSHEPSELVVTARAGTPLRVLEDTLARAGQCLPFEPPRFGGEGGDGGGTVGGMVAAGLAGPARLARGGLRDYVLGATMLNGRGELLTFGGQVMKNVAGYDVSRALAGSLGVLGVICEVSLKVLPLPPSSETVRFEIGEAEALERLCGWLGQPLPVDASAWQGGVLHLRLAGAAAAVRVARERLGGERVGPAEAEAFWAALRDHRHPLLAADRAGDAGGDTLWRLALPATAPAIAEAEGRMLIEWGGAQRWWRTARPAAEVQALAARAGGHAVRFRGGDRAAGSFAPLALPLQRIHRALKDAFDPHAVFNRGRLYPEF